MLAMEPEIHADVRPLERHGRTAPSLLADAVHDAVLGLLRRETRVRETGRGAHCVHCKRAVRRNVVLPRNGHHARVELVCRGGGELAERQEYPARQSRPQAGPIAVAKRARRGDHGLAFPHLVKTQLAQLLREHALDAEGACGCVSEIRAHVTSSSHHAAYPRVRVVPMVSCSHGTMSVVGARRSGSLNGHSAERPT